MVIEDVETRQMDAATGPDPLLEERALTFDCGGARLYGILSLPAGKAPASRGVLVVVGGPQYRAGSHRQFTLLARDLARDGVPVLRFDYRGMGDSEGAIRPFDEVEDDLRAAIDAFMAAAPGLREVVLWGLCDAASAIGMYAARDPRVAGLVLLNPWVRTEDGLARATLRHYYRARLRDPAFWKQLLRGGLDWRRSLASLLALLRKARGTPAPAAGSGATVAASLPERMRTGLQEFRGQVLLVISGADLTAREFCDLADADRAWQGVLAPPRVTRRQIDDADHTFSRRAWRDQVARWTAQWLRSW
ncbi:hydrolase 1, exosortase A system-associated [Massilia sp. CFBP9026]|uniref:hydrolase 1, exosortase A system-associated n=1 Tax=Massilia sp. CFBP9026 TaxID=3096536 RepID=UPI002A6A5ECF|nr:hydrolase 1, exosortase A system-associated [Massilia sp. CFBP9026]MDY0963381.1 hydrolase 1, exosortase A system-associated [Massilia sp. CFBP9026]